MTWTKLTAAALAAALALAGAAAAQQRFPPPEFETDYRMPSTQVPEAHSWQEYVDVAVLVVALAIASLLVIRVRYRGPIVALMVFCLLYFGFWRGGCVCPIGAIQNVTAAVFGTGYIIPLAVVLFFVLPLLTALFFGRTFCAAVCPLGAVQDLLAIRPLRLPVWAEHAFGLVAWVYLAAAVMFAATASAWVICRYDPFVAIFRLLPIGKIAEGWGRQDPELNPWAITGTLGTLMLAAGFVLIGLFVARPYCRFLCPYGAILGLLSRISGRRAAITPDQCIQCRLCEDACPFNAIMPPTANAPQRQRMRGRGALLGAVIALPVLVVGGSLAGGLLGGAFARMHPTVSLADRVRDENAGRVEGTTDASDAFRSTGRAAEDLYAEAAGIERQFTGPWTPGGLAIGAAHLFGAFVGLVVGLKLVHLSIRRRRDDYETDPAKCVACGRCFAHCPVEQAQRKGIEIPGKTPDGEGGGHG